MAKQCYFGTGLEADFYQCVTATVAGESPTTAAAKWRKIRLLERWRFALAQLTYANLLRLDGQTDKAAVERNAAYGRDSIGLDDLVRNEAQAEHNRKHHPRPSTRPPIAARGGYVAAGVILDDAYRLIGWDADQLDTRDKADARASLSQAVQEVWSKWWWQELMSCQRVQLASTWPEMAGYAEDLVFYYPAADAYFIHLLGGSLTSGNPLDSDGNLQGGFWAAFDPTATPPAVWDSATTYARGDQADYAGVIYQCRTVTSTNTLPTLLTDWAPVLDWTPILPYTAAVGGALVGPYGPIRGVSQFDPRQHGNPRFYELDVTADGTRILNLDISHPWVWSRRKTPILTGDTWDNQTEYEATDTQDLIFDS